MAKSSAKSGGLLRHASNWGPHNTTGVSIPSEIAFNSVSYDIRGVSILDDITLTAPSGKITCLLGPSGSGKTSLLRIAAGLVRQTSGQVLRDGIEIGGDKTFVPPEKRGIGLVFQDYALFPHLSVIDNVRFGIPHLPKKAGRDHARNILTRVGLEDRAGEFPENLSGGEQQRVALARALAPKPGVLLLDEPFSGLDSRLRDSVREETLVVLRETGATAILVTHDPEEALRMADNVALLHNGRLEQLGPPEALYNRPVTEFAAAFFSEINIIQGAFLNGKLQTPLGVFQDPRNHPDGATGTLVLRDSAIELEDGDEEAASPKGRLIEYRFTGEHYLALVAVEGISQPLKIRQPVRSAPKKGFKTGDLVRIHAQEEAAFVFCKP